MIAGATVKPRQKKAHTAKKADRLPPPEQLPPAEEAPPPPVPLGHFPGHFRFFANNAEENLPECVTRLAREGRPLKCGIVIGYAVLTQLAIVGGGYIGLPVTLITCLIGWTPWWYPLLCFVSFVCGFVCYLRWRYSIRDLIRALGYGDGRQRW